jgi:hypothetical protein
MKKLLGMALLVMFVASSTSLACGCGCKAKKAEDAKKEAKGCSSCGGCSAKQSA